jgi:acetoacetyl-CoA synthetase
MGTAELYSVVEDMAGVADSLVVHVEDPAGGPGRLVLLVVPVAEEQSPGDHDHDHAEAAEAAEADLRRRIKDSLRSSLSPRHVPDEIHLVRSIPRTLSGKKLELPVKRILAGEDPRTVASREALADPEALDAIVELAESR